MSHVARCGTVCSPAGTMLDLVFHSGGNTSVRRGEVCHARSRKLQTAQPHRASVRRPVANTLRATLRRLVRLCCSAAASGYLFQREGTVEGNARVGLSVPVPDINDLSNDLCCAGLQAGNISRVQLHEMSGTAPSDRTMNRSHTYWTKYPGDFGSDSQPQMRGSRRFAARDSAQQPSTTQPAP